MDKMWRDTFLMHVDTKEFRDNIEKSKENIHYALGKFSNSYIAFSGGKDSLVMLHLIKQIDKKTKIVHIKWGKYLIPDEIEYEIFNQLRQMGYADDLIIVTSKRLDTLSRVWREGSSKDYYKVVFGLLGRIIKQNDFDAVFLGLRSEESLKRKRRINKSINQILYKKSQLPEIYPISHLTWKDVWAYIIKYNLPYLQIYEKSIAKFMDGIKQDSEHFLTSNLIF